MKIQLKKIRNKGSKEHFIVENKDKFCGAQLLI